MANITFAQILIIFVFIFILLILFFSNQFYLEVVYCKYTFFGKKSIEAGKIMLFKINKLW